MVYLNRKVILVTEHQVTQVNKIMVEDTPRVLVSLKNIRVAQHEKHSGGMLLATGTQVVLLNHDDCSCEVVREYP